MASQGNARFWSTSVTSPAPSVVLIADDPFGLEAQRIHCSGRDARGVRRVARRWPL